MINVRERIIFLTTLKRKSLISMLAILAFGFSHLLIAKELKDVKDSHRPALNLPQSIEWAKKRPVGSLYALRASDVMGQSVFNGEGDEIGEVDDLVIAIGDDGQSMAIIEVGGFLGIGEKRVAVPFSQLRVSLNDDSGVFLNLTEKQLESLDSFSYTEGEGTGKQKMNERRK